VDEAEDEEEDEEDGDDDTDEHEDADSEVAEVEENEEEKEEVDGKRRRQLRGSRNRKQPNHPTPTPEFNYTPDLTNCASPYIFPTSLITPPQPWNPLLALTLFCQLPLFDGSVYSKYGAHSDHPQEYHLNKKDTHMANYTLGLDLFRVMDRLVSTPHFSKKRRYVIPAVASRYPPRYIHTREFGSRLNRSYIYL